MALPRAPAFTVNQFLMRLASCRSKVNQSSSTNILKLQGVNDSAASRFYAGKVSLCACPCYLCSISAFIGRSGKRTLGAIRTSDFIDPSVRLLCSAWPTSTRRSP